MNRKVLSLFSFLIILTTQTYVVGQTWQQIEDFPGIARDDGSMFNLGTDYYLGLGRDAGFNCTRDFYIYNAVSASWTPGTSLPTGEERQYAVGASWNDKGLIFGGINCDGIYLNDLWLFDPLLSSWTEIDALPSSGRAGSEHFIIGDSLYIVGGKNDSGILSEVWSYDLVNGEWSQKTDFPDNGVWRGLSFAWNQNGFAGYGLNSLSDLNTGIFTYDPLTQIWSPVPDFGLSPRTYPGSAQKDNLVLIFGGVNASNQILNTFDRLDLNDFTLHSLPSFPSDPRKGSMCFLSNDVFFTSTGITSTQRINEMWKISGILNAAEISIEQFKIYPNPANETCFIDNTGNLDGEISVYSLDGRLIRSLQPDLGYSTTIELTNIPQGVYSIRIENYTQLLIVSR